MTRLWQIVGPIAAVFDKNPGATIRLEITEDDPIALWARMHEALATRVEVDARPKHTHMITKYMINGDPKDLVSEKV